MHVARTRPRLARGASSVPSLCLADEALKLSIVSIPVGADGERGRPVQRARARSTTSRAHSASEGSSGGTAAAP